MKVRFVVIGLLLAAVLAAPSAFAQDAEDVFERLKEKYESIEALRAEFSQTMSSSFMDGEATSNGVLIASGEQYRVETDDQTLVTNGEVTWVYMASQKQVLINDYSEDSQAFSISDFLFNYDEKFEFSDVETESINGEEHFVLELEPKADDAFFVEAILSVRSRDNIVTRLEVEDVNGTTMIFNLKNIQINPPLEEGVFTFTPPEGVEIIDLRS